VISSHRPYTEFKLVISFFLHLHYFCCFTAEGMGMRTGQQCRRWLVVGVTVFIL